MACMPAVELTHMLTMRVPAGILQRLLPLVPIIVIAAAGQQDQCPSRM